MLGDKPVVEASKAFVTLIVRRPHAYAFARERGGLPIPGLAVLDADGKLKAKWPPGGADAAAHLKEMLEKSR